MFGMEDKCLVRYAICQRVSFHALCIRWHGKLKETPEYDRAHFWSASLFFLSPPPLCLNYFSFLTFCKFSFHLSGLLPYWKIQTLRCIWTLKFKSHKIWSEFCFTYCIPFKTTISFISVRANISYIKTRSHDLILHFFNFLFCLPIKISLWFYDTYK